MLLALTIKNFKSIREAHVRFGPFTCFIGHNGVGKSNLFDAIQFLSALTERDIADAATEVRHTSDGGYSPLDLVFGRDPSRRIELSADMVVPPLVADDFGESAKPSPTLLTYTVRLRYVTESDRLLVEYESLTLCEAQRVQELHRIRRLGRVQEIGRSGRTLGRPAHLHEGGQDSTPR